MRGLSGTAGSGQSAAVLGRGDLDVAFKSDSARNPGVFHMIIMHLKDVLHVPHIATNLVSLCSFDDERLEYVVKDDIMSLCGGKLRFEVKDRLYKIEGFAVTRNIRLEMDESGDVRRCNQFGRMWDTYDEPPDQASQAVVAPAKTPPKAVNWNIFHVSVGLMSKELLSASAKSMGVTLTRHFHPCEGCLAAKGIRTPIPKTTETRSDKPLGRIYCDLTGPKGKDG